jgi:ribosome-associated protein
MEGMLSETEALLLGDLLRDHRGADVLVLDLREIDGAWTDFFVIATSSSDTHMDGLDRHIKEFCHERGIDILRRSHKPNSEDEWRIIDLGPIVIHLMNNKTRAFYDLERLYSFARMIKNQQ